MDRERILLLRRARASRSEPELPGLAGFGGGKIATIILSPYVKQGGTSSTPYNHYGLLASIEEQFGLNRLGFAKLTESTQFRDPAIFDSTRRGSTPFDVPPECENVVGTNAR
jgi:hypothetical protein